MKLQVTVSDELVKEIDKYAKMMGISRSALCATFIGQGVLGYNKSFKIIDTLGEKFGDNSFAERFLKEMSKDDKEQ